MPGKLNVAFLWHMHQPYYRDPQSGEYALPWVRLHALKGYTDMITAVRRFGGTGVTFNLVPCLMKQLTDLASEQESDLYYRVSRKPAAELEKDEKHLILRYFFSANHDNLVKPYKRYQELLQRRGAIYSENALEDAERRFSKQDFLDLQVWFNLAWFGWAAEEQFPLIAELKRHGFYFTEDDKNQVLDLQLCVLRDVVDKYRSAWDESLIDISTTPFYHPILPLLIDNRSAMISQPNDPMPERDFSHPEDAKNQLQRAVVYIEKLLGRTPTGLWPSEGSVSPAACELVGDVGFKWLASDENVLLATLPGQTKHNALYNSYRTSDQGPVIFFRDQYLSDAIGFRYASNPADQSVDDFLGALDAIATSFKNPEVHIVSIILDGENAWEYFPDGGRSFFEELYGRLQNHNQLKLTTFSDYYQEHPPRKTLPPIFPASWIGGSFRIWIGDPVKNKAWDYLAEAADAFTRCARDKRRSAASLSEAREWLLAAEGSDWFWWYGKPNSSDFDAEFDHLFRAYLMEVYRQLNLDIPKYLNNPIGEEEGPGEKILLFPINPIIDGKESNFYEWSGARVVRNSDFSGAMSFTSSMIEKLYYGISATHFFLRIDADKVFFDKDKLEIIIQFHNAIECAASIRNLKHPQELLVTWHGEIPPIGLPEAALDTILEVKIPFANLKTKSQFISFAVIIKQGDMELESWPREGTYPCPVPSEEYLSSNWVV